MKYFKSTEGVVYAYPADGSQDHRIADTLIPIEEDEALSLANPPPTDGQLQTAERKWRDGVISSTEWLVTRHRDELDMQRPTTLTAEQFAQLLTYRQELRDWPLALQFPSPSGRPVAPPWITEQTQ